MSYELLLSKKTKESGVKMKITRKLLDPSISSKTTTTTKITITTKYTSDKLKKKNTPLLLRKMNLSFRPILTLTSQKTSVENLTIPNHV